MRTFGWILLALVAVCSAGCNDGNTHLSGDPDGHDATDTADGSETIGPDADADADGDGDADPDGDGDVAADGDGDGDGDGGADAGCLASCANDPPDGPAGTPCADDTDCNEGFLCFPESVQVYDGLSYVTWPGGYCASYASGSSACDPYDPRTCPSGSECIALGEGIGGTAYGCFDRCAVASREGVPWEDNCDCRDGYACDPGSELCFSGCSSDRECCEVWVDVNGNGRRNTGEVTLLDSSRCTDTCDRCTAACTLDGCPGGDCRIGDPCTHSSECPAGAQCWGEADVGADVAPGGICVQTRCDLVGRECPSGAGCINLGGTWDPTYYCMIPCTPGTQPGDAGYPCRDVAPPGPSAGDYACMPTETLAWYDATSAGGYCWTGSFEGGTEPIGSACTSSAECASPFGLGLCGDWGGPGFCTVMCSEATAAAGICEIDPAATAATGACYSSVCVEACDVPGGPLGANGCANPALACADANPVRAYLYVADGRTIPDGICYYACTSDAWCTGTWGAGYTCDTASGNCVP
jgi:hypothetical protein